MTKFSQSHSFIYINWQCKYSLKISVIATFNTTVLKDKLRNIKFALRQLCSVKLKVTAARYLSLNLFITLTSVELSSCFDVAQLGEGHNLIKTL